MHFVAGKLVWPARTAARYSLCRFRISSMRSGRFLRPRPVGCTPWGQWGPTPQYRHPARKLLCHLKMVQITAKNVNIWSFPFFKARLQHIPFDLPRNHEMVIRGLGTAFSVDLDNMVLPVWRSPPYHASQYLFLNLTSQIGLWTRSCCERPWLSRGSSTRSKSILVLIFVVVYVSCWFWSAADNHLFKVSASGGSVKP